MSFEHASTIRPCADTPARKDSRKLVDVAHKRTNTVPFQRDRDKPARTHGGGLLDKAVRSAGTRRSHVRSSIPKAPEAPDTLTRPRRDLAAIVCP